MMHLLIGSNVNIVYVPYLTFTPPNKTHTEKTPETSTVTIISTFGHKDARLF